jgi:predicted dehydrogenase
MRGAQHEEYCCLYGTKGQIRLPDPYGLDPLRIYLQETWGDFTAGQWHSIPTKPVPVYQLAVEDFAKAVQSKGCAPMAVQAARRVLEVVLAIYRSAAEKRTVSIS